MRVDCREVRYICAFLTSFLLLGLLIGCDSDSEQTSGPTQVEDETEPFIPVLQEFPVPAGARRAWSDSGRRLWVSEWDGGQLARYDPATNAWQEWPLPGDRRPYAVYVDETDMVWLSDFGANALVRFDPTLETFEVFELPSPGANVRQILGRPGEIWGGESGTDKLVVVRTR